MSVRCGATAPERGSKEADVARAGWCSACNNYVFLRPDGGCGNGHDASCISNVYEVPEAGQAPQVPAQPVYPAQVPVAAPPGYVPQQPVYPAQGSGYQRPPAQPAYAQPAYAQPAYPQPAPRKKRGGVIFAIIAVILLVLCGVGVAIGAGAGVIPNPLNMLASPEHQKVQVAGDFVEAMSTANLLLLRRSIPSDAANAADPAFWVGKVLKDNPGGKVVSKTWNGDTLTMVIANSDGEQTKIVLKAASGDKVDATSSDAASTDGSGDTVTLTMKQEMDGWKVFVLGSGDQELIRFDAASIKKLQQENP
jgi:hypothetical protein